MSAREKYRRHMRRMFVEQNAAALFAQCLADGDSNPMSAVLLAGDLHDAIVAEYGHGSEPIFGDGQDE